MKNIIFLILILATIYYFKDSLYFSVCDKPIAFHIGSVDPRFNISKAEFSSDVQQATSIWDKVADKQLFEENNRSALTINMVFDEKQYLVNQIDQLGNRLSQEKKTIQPEINQYESMSADFKKRVSDFNNEVAYWNAKGGAPPDEYEKLIKEQTDLQQTADQLNQMAQALNQSTEQYNQQITELNKTIGSFNQVIIERPEEGIYNPNEDKIDIYFNVTHDELVHTIAHEFGHALGLSHVNDSSSIMYKMTSRTITATPQDIQALNLLCQKRNVFVVAYNNIIQRLAALNLGF